jgi:hypothetical protein
MELQRGGYRRVDGEAPSEGEHRRHQQGAAGFAERAVAEAGGRWAVPALLHARLGAGGHRHAVRAGRVGVCQAHVSPFLSTGVVR